MCHVVSKILKYQNCVYICLSIIANMTNTNKHLIDFLIGLGFNLDSFYSVRINKALKEISLQGKHYETEVAFFRSIGFNFSNDDLGYLCAKKSYSTGFGNVFVEIIFTK